jgi:hypothetical protein
LVIDRKKLIGVIRVRPDLKRSALVLLVLGVLVALAGLVFTLQGLGYVGPVGGLMYNNPTWVTNGEITFVVGAIVVIAGFALGRQAQAPAPKIA